MGNLTTIPSVLISANNQSRFFPWLFPFHWDRLKTSDSIPFKVLGKSLIDRPLQVPTPVFKQGYLVLQLLFSNLSLRVNWVGALATSVVVQFKLVISLIHATLFNNLEKLLNTQLVFLSLLSKKEKKKVFVIPTKDLKGIAEVSNGQKKTPRDYSLGDAVSFLRTSRTKLLSCLRNLNGIFNYLTNEAIITAF